MLEHSYERARNPQRLVIVGAGGFVGSGIARAAAARNLEVLPLTRKDVDLLAPDGSERLASRLRRSDAVVFVSAIAPAKTTEQFMLNLRMVETACRSFVMTPPDHLVYISSDAVYADDANPVTENLPVTPSTLHGQMHSVRERMLRAEFAGPLAFLRPTLIYGATDPHSGYGPNRFRRQAAQGEPITVFGEGEEKRDHVAVEDVAQLALRMLLQRSTGVLNAVTGVATSFREIAEIVAAQFSPVAEVKSVPRPGPRPHLLHRFFDIAGCYKSFPDFHFEPLARGIARVHRELVHHNG